MRLAPRSESSPLTRVEDPATAHPGQVGEQAYSQDRRALYSWLRFEDRR